MQKIILNGDIGFEITLAEIMGIVKANASEEIEFVVSTYGGYVDEAWRIYNYLAKQTNVSITFDGICASAGTFAFLSIPKEKRKATKDTMFAIHLPYNNYFLESLNQDDLENEANKLNVVTEEIKQVYEKELNMTREDVDALMSPDSWFSANSALGFLMITEVVEAEKTEENKHIEAFVFDKMKAENRICAFVKKNINQKKENNMSEKLENEIKEQKSMLQNFIEEVKNLLTPKAKDLIVQTKEGVDIEIVGDSVAVGAEVVNTADGTYTATIEDVEKKIVIVDSKIESIEDVATEDSNEEMDTLRAENEALKAELETLKASKNEIENKFTDLNSKVEALEKLKSEAQNFLKKETIAQPKTLKEQMIENNKKLKNK